MRQNTPPFGSNDYIVNKHSWESTVTLLADCATFPLPTQNLHFLSKNQSKEANHLPIMPTLSVVHFGAPSRAKKDPFRTRTNKRPTVCPQWQTVRRLIFSTADTWLKTPNFWLRCPIKWFWTLWKTYSEGYKSQLNSWPNTLANSIITI